MRTAQPCLDHSETLRGHSSVLAYSYSVNDLYLSDTFDRALCNHEFTAALNEAADAGTAFEDKKMCYSTQSFRDVMKHRPTIDAVPIVHGAWLPVENSIDDDTNPAFDCSECGAMVQKQYNFCPRCGAKMDLEE